MSVLSVEKLSEYLSSLYGSRVSVERAGMLGKEAVETREELKGFGYGRPYLIAYKVEERVMEAVLETMRSEGFGHEHFSDRAGILLWQNSCFSKLPRHARSIDVGAFTEAGDLKSLGDCGEFFIIMEKVEGELYHQDLDTIAETDRLDEIDRERCRALSNYLAEIHSCKKEAPGLYVRRVRELVGHGECIMGLIDSYPCGLSYIDEETLLEVEKKCVEWRYRLKQRTHRLCQVHGDFHPWNILFRSDTDFSVLDRSRGEWGEPADDLVAMTINFIFYSLQVHGRLEGAFEELFRIFWQSYLERTGDDEMLEVVQPFYAWRGLVIASPLWYPNLELDVRLKLLGFVKGVLEVERFDLEEINSYLQAER